ncbi:GntR family transcriptional regulator [Antarctobacter jejuensis]|uniref:GntR family transcriptional regulator n=1 Tax=Antarctobacter jejuensis TaxID=1439938 RepID=UPI003FD5610F
MPTTRKDTCKAALKRRILSLDLAPGSELDESQLAGEYGLSRTPLREIFQALAGEGYLRLEVNRGARVALMDVDTLRSLFQTAPLLYSSLARLAASNRSAGLDTLRQIQSRFLAAVQAGDPTAAALENHVFLLSLGEVADNPYLLPALRRMLIDHTRLGLGFYRPDTRKEKKLLKRAVQRNEALIAAIEAGDAEQAVALVLQGWEVSRAQIERSMQADPLPLETTGVGEPTPVPG